MQCNLLLKGCESKLCVSFRFKGKQRITTNVSSCNLQRSSPQQTVQKCEKCSTWMRGSFRQYRDPKPLILEEDSADECGTSSRAFVGSRSCNSVKSGSSRIVEEMGGPYKRKKYHAGDTHLKKGWRVKRRTKDLDQVRNKNHFINW